MNRSLLIFYLSLAILCWTSTTWADAPKESPPLNDVAPNIGPVSYPPIDDSRELIFFFDAQTVCNDNQLLGCEFAGDMFYITGGSEPNQVYVCNPDGTLNFQFDQWSSPGWGWRDLVFDGTYLYGSDDYVIDAFDLDGNPVPEMNIDGPIAPNRALAYDPVTDTFWTQSFSGPLYNFDRDGNVIWTGASGVTAAYGAAWDDYLAPFDGPWLWIFDQTGVPQTTIHQYDPINHTLTGWSFTIPLIPGCTDQIAGGLAMTDQFVPISITFIGLAQGTPVDMIFAYRMYFSPQMNMPAAPENFVVTPDSSGGMSADLSWINPTETVGGNPLTSIDSILVLVDDELDTVLFGDPGQAMAVTVLLPPPPALHQFTVYCVNDYGDGTPVSQSAWIGLDVPAGVENLWGEGVGMELIAELIWDNPTAGAHGGYFPVGSIDGYTINRYGASPATFTITGIATYFCDNHIPGQGWYEYGVVPYNASGSGPEVISNTFFVGSPDFEEIPYNWIEINPNDPGAVYAGTNIGFWLNDQVLGPFDIGFIFPFYTDVTQIWICSNGWSSFSSTTSTVFANQPIPDSGEPNNLVAPFWDDLDPTQGGSVWYYSDIAEGRFFVEWYDLPHYSTGGNYRFEVILWDDGTIDYMYADLTPGTVNSATVGKENGTGTIGVQCTYNGSGPLEPEPLMGIRIYNPIPPVPIELSSFNADVIENGVLLTWTTASEIDCYEWTVQRNGDDIATLPGHGTTTEPQSYSYFDEVGSGIYTYRLKETDVGGAVTYSDPITVTVSALVTEYALNANYPNPFNAKTKINFALPEAARVMINVYDINGCLVATLADGWRNIGIHEVTFDGTGLSSGIYIVRMTSGSFNATGKMVLMK